MTMTGWLSSGRLDGQCMSLWSKLFLLEICTLFSLTTFCSSTNECSFVVDPLEKKSDFGSLNTFYRIAQSVSYGLHKPLSATATEKLKEILNNNETSLDRIESIKEIVSDQVKGSSHFVGAGIIIAVLSFLVGMVVLFMHCCSCLKKPEDMSGVVGWKAFIYSAILMASFGFILAGVIIHNQSTSHAFLSIDSLQHHTSIAILHLRSAIRTGVDSIFCAVDNFLNTTISTMVDGIRELFGVAVDNLRKLHGVFDTQGDKFTAIKNRISICYRDIANLLHSIGSLQSTDVVRNNGCNQRLALTKKFLDDLSNNLQSLEQRILSASNAVNRSFKEFDTQINAAEETLAATATQNFLKKFQSSSLYSSTKNSLNLLISVPGSLALIFVSLTTLLLIFIVFRRKSALEGRKRSNVEKISSVLSMLGFYLVAFLIWIVIGLSCLEHVAGWGVSTICRPMFNDPTFSIYNGITRTVDLPEEHRVNISVKHVLQRCRDNETMFIAVDGDKVVNTRSLVTQHGIAPLKEKLKTSIDSLKQKAIYYTQELISIRKDLGDHLAISPEFHEDITKTLLAQCVSVDSGVTREAVQHSESLSGKLTAIHTDASALIERLLINASDQFTLELTRNIFPCRSLYDAYEYAGFVLCNTIGDPLYGMWAAAVMTWLWLLPAAFIMLMRANRTSICCDSSSYREKTKAIQDQSEEYVSTSTTSH
ncbi:hypothetical protein KIN20_026987 [Parelaphostrongylus tenuis]|uniref:Prominin-1-A n=1 Tax=Parelaphostrongylus tenuis TaxID=148309 RepID=A0AAD5QYS4_PARTN|nr:hypothetical protein KIN20_026987 [Parelaphostrongylus tenuis]